MMADIEKVIKGLECCSQGALCSGNCPYDTDNDDYIEKCTAELAKDALELLKEQQEEKYGKQTRN